MIVMKFGGSSLDSGDAIRRVVSIIKSQADCSPVVVVSAMGKTTNHLLSLFESAARGHQYLAWKEIKELQEYHLEQASEVVDGELFDSLEQNLRKLFRELHCLMVEVSDEGKEATPALKDYVASFGERVSSLVMAAALNCAGAPAVHLDARQVILTDDNFGQAAPLYWETYAKLRRAIPDAAAEGRIVVLGGFIGATADGITTTLGRGGSDLSASIIGAGICAHEIQIWTDVDGLLTCDPRVFTGCFRVKAVNYKEACALAQSGAKVLHPDTVMPAIRQRIPIVIRNSRRPDAEGTTITSDAPASTNAVKSIACKKDLTVLAIRPSNPGSNNEDKPYIEQVLRRNRVSYEAISQVDGTTYVAINNGERYEDVQIELEGCVEVSMRRRIALITLVGQGIIEETAVGQRAIRALKQFGVQLVAAGKSCGYIALAVPQAQLAECVRLLHAEFFGQVDPAMFCEYSHTPSPAVNNDRTKPAKWRKATTTPNWVFTRA